MSIIRGTWANHKAMRSKSNASWAVRLVLLSFLFSSLLQHNAFAEQTQFSMWTQTSQADFESGVFMNLDTSSYPGDVRLAEFQEFVIGTPSLNRAQNWNGSLVTIALDDSSAIADRAGVVTSFEIWASNLGGTVQLKVFRDNGTHLTVLASSQVFGITENPFRKGVRLQIGTNDILGATISGVELKYDVSSISSRILPGVDASGSIKNSQWTQENRTWSLGGQVGVPGLLVSSIQDTGGVLTWGAIEWTATLGPTSSINFATRTSSDGRVWTDWSPEYGLSGDAIISPPSRFIQYRASFISGAPGDIPTLHEVKISFVLAPRPNPSSLFLWADKAEVQIGETVSLSGRILPAQVESMALVVIEPNGSVRNMTLVSDTNGLLSRDVLVSSEGVWFFMLSFSGSQTLTSASSAPLLVRAKSAALAFNGTLISSVSLAIGLAAILIALTATLRLRRLRAYPAA